MADSAVYTEDEYERTVGRLRGALGKVTERKRYRLPGISRCRAIVPLTEAGLKRRHYNALMRSGVTTVNHMVDLDPSVIANIPGVGPDGLVEVMRARAESDINPLRP